MPAESGCSPSHREQRDAPNSVPAALEIELGSPDPIFLGGEGRYVHGRVLCVFTLAH